jgi:hypothetical protein
MVRLQELRPNYINIKINESNRQCNITMKKTIFLIFVQLWVYKTVSLMTIGKPEAATAFISS